MTELYPITQDGLIKIQHDLNECMQERPKIIEAIATARDFGDLSENSFSSFSSYSKFKE